LKPIGEAALDCYLSLDPCFFQSKLNFYDLFRWETSLGQLCNYSLPRYTTGTKLFSTKGQDGGIFCSISFSFFLPFLVEDLRKKWEFSEHLDKVLRLCVEWALYWWQPWSQRLALVTTKLRRRRVISKKRISKA
jgi:hypothetical protein